MRGPSPWLLLGLLGCAPGTVRDADLVGAWGFEAEVDYGAGILDCYGLATSRFVLHEDGTGQWSSLFDARYDPELDPFLCDALDEVVQQFFRGTWEVFDVGERAVLELEVEEWSQLDFDELDSGAASPGLAVLREENFTVSWEVARGEDVQGPWLLVSGWGVHRPVDGGR